MIVKSGPATVFCVLMQVWLATRKVGVNIYSIKVCLRVLSLKISKSDNTMLLEIFWHQWSSPPPPLPRPLLQYERSKGERSQCTKMKFFVDDIFSKTEQIGSFCGSSHSYWEIFNGKLFFGQGLYLRLIPYFLPT